MRQMKKQQWQFKVNFFICLFFIFPFHYFSFSLSHSLSSPGQSWNVPLVVQHVGVVNVVVLSSFVVSVKKAKTKMKLKNRNYCILVREKEKEKDLPFLFQTNIASLFNLTSWSFLAMDGPPKSPWGVHLIFKESEKILKQDVLSFFFFFLVVFGCALFVCCSS